MSPSAAERLTSAREAVRGYRPGARVLIVGASRGAADDFARDIATSVPATFGVQRFSLTQIAARTALAALAAEGTTSSTWLGAEAVAARAVFEAAREGTLSYFAPVAATPGFPRALARTLHELRLAGVGANEISPLAPVGPALGWLLDRFEAGFASVASVDRADLFRTAAAWLRRSETAIDGAERARPLDQPPGLLRGTGLTSAFPGPRPTFDLIVFLDVGIEDAASLDLVHALARCASTVVATVPHGDRGTLDHFTSMGAAIEERPDRGTGDLACLRQFLFNTSAEPPQRALDGSLEFFSAPGEGRECVEIARRILKHARSGVRFDEMAIFVRAPQNYFGLLEHALRRAGILAWFDRGTRRPHPAGRAFLALLACAGEQLSAARFAEYLSLGQVPSTGAPTSAFAHAPADKPGRSVQPPHVLDTWVSSRDEAFGLPEDDHERDRGSGIGDPEGSDMRNPESEFRDPQSPRIPDPGSRIPENASVIEGTLRTPWRWEKLLVEAAVIGRDAARWKRRLAGKAAELERQIKEAEREDGADGGRVQTLRRTSEQLEQLRTFAVPIIEELAQWPPTATWSEWLEAFTRLVPRVLRTPEQVLRVLADLRPLGDVGPIDLDEARRVLADRLLTLESEPPARRFGRVFVGTPQQARGRSFRVVFVPGLAERMFPQKPREDPLLLDSSRAVVGPSLHTQSHRLAAERLLLQLAVGAASERLYVSYPRIELTESRARVPSFYALDVMRAATGRIPDYEWLEARAREAGNATLAWPAPPQPEDAIDDLEHDLASLRLLLDERDRHRVKGHAHYLLKLNECLRRSVIDRWARGESRWSVSDGLIRVSNDTRAVLAAQRLTARPYSLSALQRFSACPYQFLLAAVYRLQRLEQPEALQRMDPLTRGSLFHAIQAQFFRTLDDRGALPVTGSNFEQAQRVLDDVTDAVSGREYDDLAPAVDRVWIEEVASIRRDLHGWLHYVARDGVEWRPRHFEFGFGSVPGERDAASVPDEVTIEGGFQLRGAVDLIEECAVSGTLRVTDHKTGRKPDRIEKVIVGGGSVLQPVLYGIAVEAALKRPVSQGRLFYCTAAGSYAEHEIPLNERTRAAAIEVLEVIDRAVEKGFLAAAPTEDACARCDFRPVCGPDMFRRVSRKSQDRLADLHALRSRP